MHECGLAKRVTSTFEGHKEGFARDSKTVRKRKGSAHKVDLFLYNGGFICYKKMSRK